MSRILAFFVTLTFVTLPITLSAQEAETAEPVAQNQEEEQEEVFVPARRAAGVGVEERLQILEEEIERLKLKKAAPKKYESVGGFGPAASEVYHGLEGLTWGGYGEAKFTGYRKGGRSTRLGCLVQPEGEYTSEATAGNTSEVQECLDDYESNRGQPNNEFDLHRIILYAGYKFSDKIVLNTEFEYEHAGFKEGNVPEVFVEFAYVDFKLRDEFQLALGLHLVPMGITNFMHEPTTFPSVNRPRTEAHIIPSTWREMGAMAYGEFFGGAFTYRAGILNGGRGTKFSDTTYIRSARTKGSEARADDLAGVAQLQFKGIEGLILGTSYYEGDNGQNEVLEIHPATRYQIYRNSTSYLGQYESEIVKDFSDFADIKVRMADAHMVYEGGPIKFRGLFVRGWMDEDDVRAINANTGENVGMVVEGGYGELGLNVLHWARTEHKLVFFVRSEYLNTQKETAQYGLKDNIIDRICEEENISRCRKFDDLSNGQSVGIITDEIEDAINTELKNNGETWRVGGRPNPVNDRRIWTYGVAYYPHPQVVVKLDYEQWDSASDYHKDIQQRNSSNNKIDSVNFSVGFIF